LKKLIAALLAGCMLCFLAGCKNPDSLQLDLSRGYGENLKLIHLNASTEEKRERMDAFAGVLLDAKPLEKDFSMFAYYPDYYLQITGKGLEYTLDDAGIMREVSLKTGEGLSLTAIVDVNGDYVDFYLPEIDTAGASPVIYRSAMSAEAFVKLVNHA